MIWAFTRDLRTVWFNRKALILPAGIVLILVLGPTGAINAWDLVLSASQFKMVSLILVPLYLFMVSRHFESAWEALIITRVQSRPVWWWADVAALGATALMVVLGLGIVSALGSMLGHSWSWQWSPYAHKWYVASILASVPWQWCVESLGLLATGLWAMGIMTHVLTLWWRSEWLALVAMIAVTVFPVTFMEISAPALVWWFPGPQFSLSVHFSGGIPALWSFGYAVVLLGAFSWIGMIMACQHPWGNLHQPA